MDLPITDVVFVCTPEKAPEGYTAITNCPCGHDAQLWEKVMGGESGTRYLCFTKKDQEDGKVVEDMYIPGPSQQYLKKNYKIIKNTVEGEEPMWHKQLAVKRVPKSQASMVVVDLIVSRSKDSISKLYKKLAKVNSLRIAFRTAHYTPKQSVEAKMGKLSLSGSEDKLRPSLNEYNPSPTSSRRTSGKSVTEKSVPSPTDLSSYSPSPAFKSRDPMDDNVVRVQYSTPVASAPPRSSPPPSSSSPAPQAQPPTATPNPSTNFPVKFDNGPSTYPSAPSQGTNPFGPPQGSTYPSGPPQRTTPTSYPPATSSPYPTSYQTTPNPSLPYQMNPSMPPPAQAPGMMMAAFDHAHFQQPYGAPRGYPPSGPSTSGYDTSIGFSFGGQQTNTTSLPAPYNPYHHQRTAPGGGSGFAPPPPQSDQQRQNTYGFDF